MVLEISFQYIEPESKESKIRLIREPVKLERRHFFHIIESWDSFRSTENQALNNLFFGDEYSEEDFGAASIDYLDKKQSRHSRKNRQNRHCIKCNQIKYFHQFARRNDSIDGLSYYCLACSKKVAHARWKRAN